MHLTRNQVLNCVRSTAIGNVNDIGVCGELELFAHHMPGASVSLRRIAKLAWVGVGVFDEFFQASRGYRGMHHQQIGKGADVNDRFEVSRRVIGQFCQMLQYRVASMRAHQKGVAVRRGFGDRFGPDGAPPPRTISTTQSALTSR